MRAPRAPLTRCRNGHELTPDNLYPAMLKQGKRECWICRKLTERRRSLRARQRRAAERAEKQQRDAEPVRAAVIHPSPTPSYALTKAELAVERAESRKRREKAVDEAIARCRRLEADEQKARPLWLSRTGKHKRPVIDVRKRRAPHEQQSEAA